jgi:glycosyltransferase involved in cell wall biosynthesis
MRVLHFGNVANNGYNNAKLLRRLGVAADALCDESYALAQPEWEDAKFERMVDPLASIAEMHRNVSWARPEWVLTVEDPFARRRFKGQYRLELALSRARDRRAVRRLYDELRPEYAEIEDVLGTPLTLQDVQEAHRAAWMHGLLVGGLPRLLGGYDVVQAYATHPTLVLVTATRAQLVAFEHGTMRDLPFEDSWRGRMLSLAYRRAAKVIITNADVISSARRLGLENTVFIPHPVDETKYSPGRSSLAEELRASGAGPIFLAPARQDWREKRSDVMVRALGELVHGGHPSAVLFLGDWGVDASRTKALVEELRLAPNVRWTKPVPKLELIELYRAADVVLDQFTFGTFGGIAPEAMACERPVVMAFDRALHEWCFPEPPPIVDARDERSVAEALRRLADDPAERQRLGREGRAWVERHHGWRLVAERQRAIYEEVLTPRTV